MPAVVPEALRQSSAAVATSREGPRQPGLGPEGRHRDGAGNWSSGSGHLNEVNEARACLGCEADQIVHEKVDDVARA